MSIFKKSNSENPVIVIQDCLFKINSGEEEMMKVFEFYFLIIFYIVLLHHD